MVFVSVVMAVHNGGHYLLEAINSILTQTYRDIEVIIVNDASDDNTKRILDNINSDQVNVIHLQENKGAAFALNLAIEQSSGEWIAVHDADDISYRNRIEEQVQFIKDNPQFIGVGSFIKCIPGRLEPVLSSRELKSFENVRNNELSSDQIKRALYSGCPLTHGTMIYSKAAFTKAGMYDPNLRIAYDYDLWTRLIKIGQIITIPKILYQYRRYHDSLSSKNIDLTNLELMTSFSKLVRNTCYTDVSKDPSVVLFGKYDSCKKFRFIGQGLNVVNTYEKWRRQSVSETILLFERKQIDGVIVLDDAIGSKKIVSQLKRNGLELNRNLFEFYHAW